ncbi:MAG: 3'-5' exonuclease [Thiobacillus sp.]|nr:3'-5' exonuclease [Thiobacillus sp.]
MSWLDRFFGNKPAFSPQQARRLAAWQALPSPRQDTPLKTSRYVVVDVESSGLNISRDRLIAIGAVAVTNGQIQLNDSLEIVLQQARVSAKDNILIHGIGGTAQREGMPPAEALLAFLEYLGKDPLIAFHVAFDESMISRAMKAYLGLNFRHAWADLAYVAPALYPQLARRYRKLDDWMSLFQISNYARHNALADALSTAEVLLALSPSLEARKAASLQGLKSLERERRRQIQPV